MRKRTLTLLFAVAGFASPGFGQAYSVTNICAPPPGEPVVCIGEVLNDQGFVAGIYEDLVTYIFLFIPGQGLTLIKPQALNVTLLWMNLTGVIVGQAVLPELPPTYLAVAYVPGNNELLTLNSVFGWKRSKLV